ncbi:MAG TPA: isoprenylcysteine carboxylmethyltransferase family protein [Gaiellales bacterium]|nr:isoprenylcysteine carboxylmethyltransferase family protein [Gaiellales bacterium]
MALAAALIAICWIVWAVTWIVTALIFRPPTTDARTPGQVRRRSRSFRLILAALFIAVSSQHVGDVRFGTAGDVPGVALCAGGVAIAVWARVCLGRNWGMPMTVRGRPALVRRGPYRGVRHPICSGILLAAVGTALVAGAMFLVVAVGAGAYFVMSLRIEEADMTSLFPNDYPRYAAHTKRLIPFVY